MVHIPYEKWLQYVADELDDETRRVLESHLYECDQCLQHYLQAIEVSEQTLPMISDEHSFVHQTMATISKRKRESLQSTEKKNAYKQTVIHYIVAAVATFILTFSGLFTQLAHWAGDWEKTTEFEPSQSVTDRLMEKTLSWVDTFENNNREANSK